MSEDIKNLDETEMKNYADKRVVIKRLKGQRKLKNGEIKEYTYNRKYILDPEKKRGRRTENDKSLLRKKIKELDNEQCKLLLDYLIKLR